VTLLFERRKPDVYERGKPDVDKDGLRRARGRGRAGRLDACYGTAVGGHRRHLDSHALARSRTGLDGA
jgi:hypothetical protein